MLHVHAVDKKKQVDDICDRCNSDMPGIKQAANLLEKEFANQGLLTHKRWTHGGRGFSPENRNNYGGCPAFRTWKMVDPKETGWSPRNRDNYGGSPSRALELIDHIATVGFSPHDMEHATFEQVKPGSTETQTFNENLAEGDMASAPASPAIKYGSIAGSHAYAGFRAIIAGVPHTSEFCSKDGRLSIDVLRERDPIYAKYALEGVRAKVPRARRGRADKMTDGRASAPASVPAVAPVLARAVSDDFSQGAALVGARGLPACHRHHTKRTKHEQEGARRERGAVAFPHVEEIRK